VETINIGLASLAGLALVMGLFTYWIRRHWINEPLLALLLGVAIGPHGLGWLDLSKWGEETAILEVAARLTLAVTLVSVGLELHGYLSHAWRSLTLLVLAGLALMWGISSLLVGWILGLDLLPAILIGAVLAPIDPILTATVATGKVARENLPEHTRHLLSAESSARHGIGLVVILLPVLLLTKSDTEAWSHWLTWTLLWRGLSAVVLGWVIGYTTGRLLHWSTERQFTEERGGSLVAIYLALSLAVVSLVELMGADGVLAVVVAGIAFASARLRGSEREELERQERHYEEVVKQVLQVPVFALLGTALPWAEWANLGWTAAVLIIAVLLLRRMPAILLLKPVVGGIRRWDEALFIGWFGPIGVGALYFATVAHKETHLEEVWGVTTLLIAVAIVLHDLTATPLIQWLGRRMRS
jgi:NhaP-type Na+/H+ or K+/H+ antiporter